MSRIRVPLAVDAQLRIPLGPTQLPVRTCLGLAATTPLACVALLTPLPLTARVALAVLVTALGVGVASQMRQGIWIGSWLVLHWLGHRVPAELVSGCPVQPPARHGWRRWLHVVRVPQRLRRLVLPPEVGDVETGLLSLHPGGWRAVLELEGPAAAMDSLIYARWCETVVRWLGTLRVPAQLVTTVGHVDRAAAEAAHDAAVRFTPSDGPLVRGEREFAGETAARSLAFRHHVVLAPHLVAADGLPPRLTPLAASRVDAENALAAALSAGRAAGLRVEAAPAGTIRALLAASALDAERTTIAEGETRLDGHLCAGLTVTQLGSDVDLAIVVDALQRSGFRGAASLHLLPVQRAEVRRQLQRRRLWLRYAIREGRPDIDMEVSLGDTETLQAELAAGRVTGLRVALAFRPEAGDVDALEEQVRTLQAILGGHGWTTERITAPRLGAAWLGAPGTAPLRRSVLLTTDAVATRLLVALGTPFTEIADPIVGINLRTGSAAHLSVFSRPNFNAVIVGSSGAGKSATAKTLLIRHVLRGAGACILDPDSEYRGTVQLLGGTYHELPEASLNPLAIGRGLPPDQAASRIVPVLSVMAGDELEYRGGRPVRRLAAEDKAVLHTAIRAFMHVSEGRPPRPLALEPDSDPGLRESGSWSLGAALGSQAALRATRSTEAFTAGFELLREAGIEGMCSDELNVELRGAQSGSPGEHRSEYLLHELVTFLNEEFLIRPSLSPRSREQMHRVALRLEGYCHGELGRIFDRPTSFAITSGSVTGIGFQALSLSYAADLTPALCVVLSHLLDAITAKSAPMIIMVDEAHVLTADPDAGQVLEQLVRRARKCRAGVWMASQKIEEFTASELGRTLASTAATKIVLGHEDTVAERVRSLFDLAEDESAALTPPVPGRAVLIAGSERTIVQVTPGATLWPFVAGAIEIPLPDAAHPSASGPRDAALLSASGLRDASLLSASGLRATANLNRVDAERCSPAEPDCAPRDSLGAGAPQDSTAERASLNLSAAPPAAVPRTAAEVVGHCDVVPATLSLDELRGMFARKAQLPSGLEMAGLLEDEPVAWIVGRRIVHGRSPS